MSTLNATFKTIADPSRRKILHLLRQGEMTAGNLAEYFDMTKPTVSHRFSILKNADLVSSRKDG
jgi:DNA-binding transcriptional ArsR family regulator